MSEGGQEQQMMQQQVNLYSDDYQQQFEEVENDGREVVFRSSITLETDQIAQMNDMVGSAADSLSAEQLMNTDQVQNQYNGDALL